ncbi:MAG: hypothetical protein A2636_05535 [Elusimicrobia bacterium RIFCSPHIGHO2_01_FULL_64_10]|nr:MAG: hypothetical protein A2636_05535 [Elusimicrobia bacterium RIFCSPHIGHO2_01_FULL_64_10]
MRVFATSAVVHLDPNGNPAGTPFRVQASSDGFSTVTASSDGVNSGSQTLLVLSGMAPNTTYQIGALALNYDGLASSRTLAASTATLPAVPTGLSFSSTAVDAMTLSWSPNGNPLDPPTSYQAQISSDSFATFVSSDVTALSWRSSGLLSATTYSFRVFAFGVGGSTSAFSAVASTFTLTAPPVAPSSPTAFTVTAIAPNSITFGWADNSNGETGFLVLNSTDGLYGTAAADSTSLQISGLGADTPVSARIAAFNDAGATTGPVVITSHTLANPPASPVFVSVDRNRAEISWSTASNPSTVPYEISESTDNFLTVLSTPLAFSGSHTSSAAVIHGLAAGGTYYFRVRAQNGDGIATAFSAAITTVTPGVDMAVSTGGVMTAGETVLTADAGVVVINDILPNGVTQQTLVSTRAAQAVYGNGVSLSLPASVEAKIIPLAAGLVLTSTRAVPVTNAGVTFEISSGTLSIWPTDTDLTLSVSSVSLQDCRAALPADGKKTVSVELNPPSGQMKVSLAPGVLSRTATLRIRKPGSFPRAASRWNLSSLGPAPSLPAAALNGTGIGLEISSEDNAQPTQFVPLGFHYRPSDVEGTDPETLTVARYEESVGRWIPLSTTRDADGRFVIGKTNHFSSFQLMALSPAADLSQAKVYPNPLRLDLGRTEVTFADLTSGASIRIFTYAGELVREIRADASGIARWDARNTYGRRVAGGMYVAVIEGAGGAKTKLKVAVEK